MSSSTASLVGGIDTSIQALYTSLDELKGAIAQTENDIQSNIDQTMGLKECKFVEGCLCTEDG